ncbi:MAG: hypothetical protein RLZZ106_789, partial [Cyanobacteriota bacterium]
NKCDLVEEPRLQALEQELRQIKTDARILRAVKGEVPLPLLLSVGLFESDKVVAGALKPDPQLDHSSCDHDHGHCSHEHSHDHSPADSHQHGDGHDHSGCDHDHGAHGHDHGHHHDHSHGHDDGHGAEAHAIEGFTSLSFQSDGPFALRKFQNFLDNQLPAGVFRAKGILWFNESQRRHVFHLAGKRFSIDDSDWPSPERKNQIVLIGKELNHAKLRQQLQACVARDAGKGFA